MKRKLYQGDCLEVMQNIPDGCVDLVLTDLPYGTTECEWDTVIPFAQMWDCFNRISKPNSSFITTASQPFTTFLIASGIQLFKYCLVWHKSKPVGHLHAKNKPLKTHEDIVVFSRGAMAHSTRSDNRMIYNPQGIVKRKNPKIRRAGGYSDSVMTYRPSHKDTLQEYENYPSSVLRLQSEKNTIHPTQKPVSLFEHLVQTYSDPGNIVLDCCMGAGTTGVACFNTGRNFIGIEKDPAIFSKAKARIDALFQGVLSGR